MADMKIALLVVLIMITVTPITPQLCDPSVPALIPWHNTWHKSFYAYCTSSNHFLSRWISYYRQCQGDRLHYFKCSQGPANGSYIQHCSWTNLLHLPTQAYFKGCANNGFITGVISVYDPATSDRVIKFRCCRIWGYKPGQGYVQYLQTNCLSTWYKNYFGQTLLNYQVPFGYTLTGVGSSYNS
ncbi:hypothetical protein ACROYT_G036004 [Oculina patagonica]